MVSKYLLRLSSKCWKQLQTCKVLADCKVRVDSKHERRESSKTSWESQQGSGLSSTFLPPSLLFLLLLKEEQTVVLKVWEINSFYSKRGEVSSVFVCSLPPHHKLKPYDPGVHQTFMRRVFSLDEIFTTRVKAQWRLSALECVLRSRFH